MGNKRVRATSPSGFSMGRTCFDSEGVKLRRGELHLTVKKVKPFTCRSPFGNFTSEDKGGDISTWGRFSQTYGRWLNSGEIDVAEWWSSRHEYVHPSLHHAGRDFWEDTGWDCHIGASDTFRTYAVEWSPEVIRFYVDGRL